MMAEISRIATPMPVAPRAVNAYLVPLDGGGRMLVDGGLGSDEAWAALDEGVRARSDWSDVRVHFVTHMHQDHVGLVDRIRNACGASLLMGELDATRRAHAASEPVEEARYRESLLRRSGVPPAIISRAMTADPGQARTPFVPVDREVTSGDTELPLANEWCAIWTPGHTAGHTALFRERDGVLISGDAVLPGIEPTIGVNRQRADPVTDHLESLARLHKLSPQQILPGHGEPLHGVQRIRASRDALLAEAERILTLVGSGESAWEINLRIHAARELRTGALLHELRGTLAQLERHLIAGRLHCREDDGVRRFSAAG